MLAPVGSESVCGATSQLNNEATTVTIELERQ